MAASFTRRTFAGTLAGAAVLAQAQQPAAATFAYVGCFTTAERKGRGDGIHVYRIDPASGDWTQTQVLKGLVNPSFLQMRPGGKVLYSSHGDGDFATAYSVDEATGNLTVINSGKT